MQFLPSSRSAACLLLFTAAACTVCAVHADEVFPSRTMTIVVPSAPGGAPDIGARLIAKEMTSTWKVPVVVDNRPGSSGILASSLVAHAPKDGYTMMLTFTAHVQLPSLNSHLPYDPLKDFVAVSQTSRSYSILAVPADFPANTVQEFVAKVKASPTLMSYGSSGAGTTSHLYGDLFDKQAGTKMNHVPYKSAVLLIQDMMGGHVKVGFTDVGATIPYIRSGKIKALAVIGPNRIPALPNVPTFQESGYKGFEQVAWMGFVVPSGVPKERVDKLSAELARITRSEPVSRQLNDVNLEVVGSTADEFNAVMIKDFTVWKDIIGRSGIKLD